MDRSPECQVVRHIVFIGTVGSAGRQPIQKRWPTLLEEGQERLPVGDNALQRPVGERATLPYDPEKAFVEHSGNTLPAVMAAEQYVQEIRRLFKEFWGNLKDMPQDKILARVVSQGNGALVLLGAIQSVKVATVQCSVHRIAKSRKYTTQGERELSSRLQQIEGERIQIAGRGP